MKTKKYLKRALVKMTEAENARLRTEISKLSERLREVEGELSKKSQEHARKFEGKKEIIARYCRQLLIFDDGLRDQAALKSAKVLIVGAGGLGCPSSQYLVGAGVGEIGILDWDPEIDISNLHRQILHPQDRILSSMTKAASACLSLSRLNPGVILNPIEVSIHSGNALDIISHYDLVLDASDNAATRYLLNDACVLAKKPLVSGSALRFEGQLTVYNYPPDVGTTYRCLFPEPPPPETVTNCSDGGVLGVVPGVIGTLQALEALKIILGKSKSVYAGKLLLFDALSPTGIFRTIKLRQRCAPAVEHLIDYEEFCGAKASDKDASLNLLDLHKDRIDVHKLNSLLNEEPSSSYIIIDVRSAPEHRIASFNKAKKFPLSDMDDEERLQDLVNMVTPDVKDVLFICRRGNDSQKAVLKCRSHFGGKRVRDIVGGLNAWAREIDIEFPIY